MSKVFVCPECDKEYGEKEANDQKRMCEKCYCALRKKKEKKNKQYSIKFDNFTLTFTLPVRIGRNHQEELKNNSYISREHCEIIEENGIIYVIDSSTNGTFLNGNKITTKTSIQNNDKIKLANIEGIFKEIK